MSPLFLNNKSTQALKIVFCLIICLAVTAIKSYAQSITNPGGEVDGINVPIDGGISLLVLAGVGYGAKKLKEKRAAEEQSKM